MNERRTLPNVVRLDLPAIDRVRLGARIRRLPLDVRVALSFFACLPMPKFRGAAKR